MSSLCNLRDAVGITPTAFNGICITYVSGNIRVNVTYVSVLDTVKITTYKCTDTPKYEFFEESKVSFKKASTLIKIILKGNTKC